MYIVAQSRSVCNGSYVSALVNTRLFALHYNVRFWTMRIGTFTPLSSPTEQL